MWNAHESTPKSHICRSSVFWIKIRRKEVLLVEKKEKKNLPRLLSSTYPSYRKFWQRASPGKPNSYNDVFKKQTSTVAKYLQKKKKIQ